MIDRTRYIYMVETSRDRQNGDLFWKKKNLLTTAETIKRMSSGQKKPVLEKSFSMIPETTIDKNTRHKNEIADLLTDEFIKETGFDPKETVMSDLPGFKFPDPFVPNRDDREVIGLTGCREAHKWLSAFVCDHPGLFSRQSIRSVLFNNEGIVECRERAVALRESVEAMITEGDIRHLNDKELSELLDIRIESEVIARTTLEIISFAMWAADKTLSQLRDTLPEDFIAMNSTLIRKHVTQYMTMPERKDKNVY